jgi:hypothetical protein
MDKIKCECGMMLTKYYIPKHKKTTKHLLLTKQIKYEFVNSDEE